MRIEQIKEKFEIDNGAPTPTIVSNEHNLYLVFYVGNFNSNWDGTNVHMRTNRDDGIVTIKFDRFAQFKFGNPNDESIEGHPLYNLGLKPYTIHKVVDSIWIKELTKMNSVHPYHKDEQFEKYEHFIFFFHDTCFEIVAEDYSIERNSESNMRDEILRIGKII